MFGIYTDEKIAFPVAYIHVVMPGTQNVSAHSANGTTLAFM
jgi:hypothetical protein